MAIETPQEQGVPEVYLQESGKFKIGHDARLKADLVDSALGLIDDDNRGDSLHIFTKAQAEKILKARGWESWLARKREIVDAKAARKAENEKKAEERRAEQAKIREEKAAAKAKEKEEAVKAKADAEKAKAAEAEKADKAKAAA